MGCTRTHTPEDHVQPKKIAHQDKLPEKISKERRKKIREAMNKAPAELLGNILADENHRAHQSVVSLAAKAFLCDMETMHQEKVPQALSIVLNKYPAAMGIFKAVPKHRAPGADPLTHHYEITSTAALMQKSYPTISGKKVSIATTDRIDFGVKMAKGYAQPIKHGTIEADVFVWKDDDINAKTLGIDQKFSKSRQRGVPSEEDFKRQLAGIRTGFRDGKIDAFCFVTNGFFDKKFKDMVNETNLHIAKEYARKFNQNLKHINPEHLTPEERANTPDKNISTNQLDQKENLKDFLKQYDIPQIDMCQHVNFKDLNHE